MVDWPTSFPAPRFGTQVQRDERVTRTPMDSGAVRLRYRPMGGRDRYTLTVRATSIQQAAEIEQWIYANGYSVFGMDVASPGGATILRTITLRLIGRVSVTQVGGTAYDLAFDAEQTPLPTETTVTESRTFAVSGVDGLRTNSSRTFAVSGVDGLRTLETRTYIITEPTP